MCWACCCGSAGPVFPLFCFVCLLVFGFVVSLSLFVPAGSAGMGGHRWWAGVVGGVLAFVVSFVTVGR